ncbi:hypothetical protein ACLGIH_32425 [Streptomyces sp. HMX87]|uniref:hypothetical protein n=1 Tax=Streptomyces sp. HMX87 TaxID=3390849 RepID=UPI003A8B59B5
MDGPRPFEVLPGGRRTPYPDAPQGPDRQAAGVRDVRLRANEVCVRGAAARPTGGYGDAAGPGTPPQGRR